MADTRHSERRKVSLEQLIQLKRSERPDPSFWDDFDRELHRRQLAALVTLEPWHRRALRTFGSVARRLAPVGATAAALAFATLAILRVEPSRPAAPETTGTVASDADARVVLLPEEAITVSDASTQVEAARPPAEIFRGHVRSAPQELAGGLASARRFVAVSAPVTISSGDDTSAIYSAKALTAGAVLRTFASAAPESL